MEIITIPVPASGSPGMAYRPFLSPDIMLPKIQNHSFYLLAKNRFFDDNSSSSEVILVSSFSNLSSYCRLSSRIRSSTMDELLSFISDNSFDFLQRGRSTNKKQN